MSKIRCTWHGWLLAIAALPMAARAAEFANGAAVDFKSPAGANVVSVKAPLATPAFQGMGVNLTRLRDMQSVACVARPGGQACGAPPNPAVSAASVRAAIGLPFAPDSRSYYNDGTGCMPVSLTSRIDFNDPQKTNDFFDSFAATQIYSDASCSGTSSSIQDAYGDLSNCAGSGYKGTCFINDVAAKNLDWVQVYFTAPQELMPVQYADKLAAFKAGQLVYQTELGEPPKFVELFNEPENFNLQPAQYSQFLASFKDVLPRLVQQRQQGLAPTDPRRQRLAKLAQIQVVGPGLGSAYKLDYVGDPASPVDNDAGLKNTVWFSAQANAQAFFADATNQGLLLSSHTYDEKRLLADQVHTLDALADLKNLFRIRDLFQNTSPVLLTEATESIEHDDITGRYMDYCKAATSGSLPMAPARACGPPGPDDVNPNFGWSAFFGYPECITGTMFQNYQAVADLCHHQMATLSRNLLNFANQGVVSELIWSLAPSFASTRHGLLTLDGQATLMNAATEPLLKATTTLRYGAVYPASWSAASSWEAIGAVAVFSTPAGAAAPTTARVALANTDSASRVYAFDFGTTPFAQFTKVTHVSTAGGLAATYTGSTIEAANPLTTPGGATFGSGNKRLVVTLPPRSVMTLDLSK
ncbi:MAG TPA: hypothetical protein VIO33_04555 [Burkholderiaceae bacterium]